MENGVWELHPLSTRYNSESMPKLCYEYSLANLNEEY